MKPSKTVSVKKTPSPSPKKKVIEIIIKKPKTKKVRLDHIA